MTETYQEHLQRILDLAKANPKLGPDSPSVKELEEQLNSLKRGEPQSLYELYVGGRPME